MHADLLINFWSWGSVINWNGMSLFKSSNFVMTLTRPRFWQFKKRQIYSKVGVNMIKSNKEMFFNCMHVVCSTFSHTYMYAFACNHFYLPTSYKIVLKNFINKAAKYPFEAESSWHYIVFLWLGPLLDVLLLFTTLFTALFTVFFFMGDGIFLLEKKFYRPRSLSRDRNFLFPSCHFKQPILYALSVHVLRRLGIIRSK